MITLLPLAPASSVWLPSSTHHVMAGAQVQVLFVGCSAVAVHGCCVCAFEGAVVYVVRGDA